jgi:transposase-like protein
VWVDGVHFRVRLEEDRLCTLVMIGVRPDGTKELVAVEYEAKYPKAVTSLRRDQAQLLTFYDFPAEHWRHLRTTNVIESPFATVRLRQRVAKGAGSRTKALMMAFKLLAMAEERWRKVNAPDLLPLVRAGIRFVDGVQEKPKTTTAEKKENAA